MKNTSNTTVVCNIAQSCNNCTRCSEHRMWTSNLLFVLATLMYVFHWFNLSPFTRRNYDQMAAKATKATKTSSPIGIVDRVKWIACMHMEIKVRGKQFNIYDLIWSDMICSNLILSTNQSAHTHTLMEFFDHHMLY